MKITLTIIHDHGHNQFGLYKTLPGSPERHPIVDWSSANTPDDKPAKDQVIESIIGMLNTAPYFITEAVLMSMTGPPPGSLPAEEPIDPHAYEWDPEKDAFVVYGKGPDAEKLGSLVYAVGIVHWGTIDGRSGSMPTKAEAKACLQTAINEKWPLEEATDPIGSED